MDKHICGTCGSLYTTIEDFIRHKRSECSVVPTSPHVVPTIDLKLTPTTRSKADSHQQQSEQKLGNPGVTSVSSVEPSSETPGGSSRSSTEPEGTMRKKRLRKKKAENQETAPKGTLRKNQREKRKPKQYIKQFKCDFELCKFVTAHQKDLHRHRRIHTGEKPFGCQFCEKRFSRDDKRKLHERAHTKEKPFACEVCTYRCADGGSLKKHMRIHSGARPYQCQLCPYASRNSSQLVVHLRRHTGDSPFHCQQCESKFKTNTDLKRHILIHTGSKPFACDQCNYRSHLKCNLKSHIQTNHRGKLKYKCDACQFQCRTQKQMDNHCSSEHGTALSSHTSSNTTSTSKGASEKNKHKNHRKVYSCDYCSYIAKHQSTLFMHIKKKHPEKGKAVETSNAKTAMKIRKALSKSKKGARNKTRTSKTAVPMFDGKRPWSCEDCEASFVREDSYRSHRRQHELLQENTKGTVHSVLQVRNSPKSPHKRCDERHCNISNSDDTVVIPVDTDCQSVTLIDGSEHYSGRTENTSLRNNASQHDVLNHKSKESPQIINSTKLPHLSSNSSTDAFSIPEIPSTGADLCAPGNASLITSTLSRDLQTDSTMNILPESSDCQATACPGELVTMMPININRASSELSTQAMPPEIIVAEDSDTYIQEVVEVGQLQQEEAIQTQTLGYGTSNIPVLLSTVSHSPTLATPVVPSTRSSCQTVVISAMKTSQNQNNVHVLEPVGMSITQPSHVKYVSLSNIGVRGASGIPVVYANQSQAIQPTLSTGAVQQVASKQQHQQILLGDQNCFGSVNLAANNNAMTVNTASLTVSNLGVSISSSITGTQPHSQIAMQTSSLPTRTFILNGRELSQAGPEITSDAIILPKVPQ